MTSTGPGSSQAHLLALLRAIRLRTEAPGVHTEDTAETPDDLVGPPPGGAADEPDVPTRPMTRPQTGTLPPSSGGGTGGSTSGGGAGGSPPGSNVGGSPSASGAAVQTPAGSAVQVPPGSAVAARPGSSVVLSGGAGATVPSAARGRAAPPLAPAGGPHPPGHRGAVIAGTVIPGTDNSPVRRPGAAPAAHGSMPAPGGPRGAGVLPGFTGPVGPVIPPAGRPAPGGHDPHHWPYPSATTMVPGSTRPMSPIDAPLHVPPPVTPHQGTAVDGPDPSDDVALHHLHEVLATSLTLAGGVDEVAGRLRGALVLAQPRLAGAVPGTEAIHTEQLAQALTWLVDNLEHPPVLAAGCGQLGAALREFGVQPHQLQLAGAALAEALRAGMAGAWRQEYDAAWRSTWHHVHQWMTHGADAALYQPTRWTAVVTEHDLRRPDLAVLRLRPYIPMPFHPGQYARVEVAELPGVWRPYSLAGAPRVDNVLELHVRAKGISGVSGALVHRVRAGDRVRLSRAEGRMILPPAPGRDLLFIVGDTGVAPVKALFSELAATGDPRSAVLFWGARTLDELYDIDEVLAIARSCQRAGVVPVIFEGDPGPYASGLVTDAVTAYGDWSRHEVYLAGPPPMLAATRAVLRGLGLDDERIHHDPTEVERIYP